MYNIFYVKLNLTGKNGWLKLIYTVLRYVFAVNGLFISHILYSNTVLITFKYAPN